MLPNITTLIICAFIPLVVRYAWYHPILFGSDRWSTAATGDYQGRAVGLRSKGWSISISLLLNFLVAFGLYKVVLHQAHVIGMTGGDLETIKTGVTAAFMQVYGHTHQHFHYGVLHALALTLLCFFIPVVGYAVVYEFRSRSYFLISLSFWAINLSMMGGFISAFGTVTIV